MSSVVQDDINVVGILMWCRVTFRVAAVAASTQQAAGHEKRRQVTDRPYGLLAQRLCNFMADDGALGRQMMAGYWEVRHGGAVRI